VPSTLLSILVGALNGYALSFWRSRWARLAVRRAAVGAFIPYQVFLYRWCAGWRSSGLFGTLTGIVLVHTVFGMP